MSSARRQSRLEGGVGDGGPPLPGRVTGVPLVPVDSRPAGAAVRTEREVPADAAPAGIRSRYMAGWLVVEDAVTQT